MGTYRFQSYFKGVCGLKFSAVGGFGCELVWFFQFCGCLVVASNTFIVYIVYTLNTNGLARLVGRS